MSKPENCRFRFAPSPNGLLHLGHAYSAILNFTQAKAASAEFLLRIEDIDIGRSRDKFISAIYEDLEWLGLFWPKPVLRQSSRFDAYREATKKLNDLGVIYPCFATRKEIATIASNHDHKRDPDGTPLYQGLYRDYPTSKAQTRIAQGEAHALRINVTKAIKIANERLNGQGLTFEELDSTGEAHEVKAEPMRWGDAVIVRKDTPASYHLAVVVDDAFQKITNVVRGQDLEASTDIHRLLQVLLDLPAPMYHHHRLIEDQAGIKLSKSTSATSLRQLRKQGETPKSIYERLGVTGLAHYFTDKA